tara:strand:+ start:6531 stop:7448 length:918 start_codon:yes stop_codon:yes gene_type:complete
MNPFFSVVIPLYNKKNYIKRTLESVLNQTFKDFEIIIVNDGSTDNGLLEIENTKDHRITIYNQPNLGVSSARNSGIRKAKANYIAFLDADDLWCENYLVCIFDMISNYNDSLIFATGYIPWYKKKTPNLKSLNFNKITFNLITNYFELAKNIFSYSSIIFHKKVFENIGYFKEGLTFGEEEDFSIRSFLKYDLVFCKKAHVYYLQNIEDQITMPKNNKEHILPDYDIYLQDSSSQSLKKYIDFIYIKLIILFKKLKQTENVNLYKRKISTKNLTFVQKIKYHVPTKLFYLSKRVYELFSKRLIHS